MKCERVNADEHVLSLAEGQTHRIGASATFIQTFLVPVRAERRMIQPGISHSVETVAEDVIERRLHDLTLDFGVVANLALSRPLQSRELGGWRVKLWVSVATSTLGVISPQENELSGISQPPPLGQ